MSRSLSCIFDIANSKRPASSLPSTVIGRVRLPSAICSAAFRALAIGWVMLLVSIQANNNVRAVAITSRTMTRLNAESYCSADRWLVSRVCWVLISSKRFNRVLIASELLSRSVLSRLRSSST
ncbi:hypothetical protein D3C80_1380910 [compost metagenome]